MPALTSPLPGSLCRYFSRRQHSSYDGSIELVFALVDRPRIILHPQDEDGKVSFFVEVLFGNRYGEDAVESVLTVCGFVTMFSRVPGEYADLIEVERQPIVGIGQHAKILWDFFLHAFVIVLNLIQREESDETLSLGILGNVERDIDVDHARQYPSHTAKSVPHQPPVFEYRSRGRLGPGLGA